MSETTKHLSKKLIVTVVTVVFLIASDVWGKNLNPETLELVKEMVFAYLASQGLVDIALVAKESHRTQINLRESHDLEKLPPIRPLDEEDTKWLNSID